MRPKSATVSEGHATADAGAMKIDIQAKSGNFGFECRPGEKILFAGLRAGLALPYECGTGTCGTCKARVLSGEIVPGWASAPGRSYVKAEKNEFLMCQATAKGPCALQVPGKMQDDSRPAFAPDYRQGRMDAVTALTHDVVAFGIELDRPLDFEPGQFVVVETPAVEGARAYSMTNYGREVRRLDFVVKRKPAGMFSDWLFAGGNDGQKLAVFGPLGRAIYRADEDKNLLCIAGGSGIAGMMAIVAAASAQGHFSRHRGRVFFGVRAARDVFFADQLAAAVAAATGSMLEVTIALSDEEPPAGLRAQYPGLAFASGFVHAVTAERMKDKFADTVAFVAGPPPMVDGALRMLILEARLPAKDIRYDKFG